MVNGISSFAKSRAAAAAAAAASSASAKPGEPEATTATETTATAAASAASAPAPAATTATATTATATTATAAASEPTATTAATSATTAAPAAPAAAAEESDAGGSDRRRFFDRFFGRTGSIISRGFGVLKRNGRPVLALGAGIAQPYTEIGIPVGAAIYQNPVGAIAGGVIASHTSAPVAVGIIGGAIVQQINWRSVYERLKSISKSALTLVSQYKIDVDVELSTLLSFTEIDDRNASPGQTEKQKRKLYILYVLLFTDSYVPILHGHEEQTLYGTPVSLKKASHGQLTEFNSPISEIDKNSQKEQAFARLAAKYHMNPLFIRNHFKSAYPTCKDDCIFLLSNRDVFSYIFSVTNKSRFNCRSVRQIIPIDRLKIVVRNKTKRLLSLFGPISTVPKGLIEDAFKSERYSTELKLVPSFCVPSFISPLSDKDISHNVSEFHNFFGSTRKMYKDKTGITFTISTNKFLLHKNSTMKYLNSMVISICASCATYLVLNVKSDILHFALYMFLKKEDKFNNAFDVQSALYYTKGDINTLSCIELLQYMFSALFRSNIYAIGTINAGGRFEASRRLPSNCKILVVIGCTKSTLHEVITVNRKSYQFKSAVFEHDDNVSVCIISDPQIIRDTTKRDYETYESMREEINGNILYSIYTLEETIRV